MASTQLLVLPKLPTVLANDTHIELPGYDIWLYTVHAVFVIPAELEASKFDDALSRVLQLYPHAAGKLRCCEQSWSIELTNSAVPLDVEYKHGMDSDSFLDGDWVVQNDLSPFLSQQSSGAKLVNGDAPLLRFKLTFFENETGVCISWNHSLGDGTVLQHFIHTLSQFYQGLPHEFPVPTFKKFHFPTPSHSTVADLSPLLPRVLAGDYDEATYINSLKDLGCVRWRINAYDLEVLRSGLYTGKQNSFLSKYDCLVAYVVSVLNYNRIDPMKRVTSTSTYRYATAPFIAENVASNLLAMVSANIPKHMAGVATAVRDARIQTREPFFIYMQGMLRSKLLLDTANAGKLPPFQTDEDELIVNSHMGFDWHAVHFGYPEGTRYFGDGWDKNYLKIGKSNPAREDKGTNGVQWRTRPSIDITFGVAPEMRQRVMETLAQGVRSMLNLHSTQGARL